MADDDHPVFPWLTRPRRAWLYRVTTAVTPLTIAYGAIEDSTAPLWVGLFAAVIGTGTAAAHTTAVR